ncbi:MAG: hypothetical protein Q9205_003617 [Flavoplaca limonia]
MFNIKKRLRKDKKKAPDDHLEGPSQALSPPHPPSPPPSIPDPGITPIPDGRRLRTPLGLLTSEPTSGLSQRPRSRSADRRGDPLGLTIIHEPKSPPHCDLIFVHGLGGTSRATWAKGRDPDYCWPQEWLPVEPGIGGARILSFGYNANFAAAGPAPITGIADFARDLLYAMKYAKGEDLEELELGQRPIVFVLHSMGGLVAKQAYILGKDDPSYSDMISSVRAMMFLATPHRGSNLAEVLNRILAASIFNHSPKLYVAELKNGSRTIEALNDQFRHIAPRLKIISFFETLPTYVGPKKTMVVEKGSATMGYPNEISKSMNADHHTVCKFDNKENSDYISVRNALKTLITDVCLKGVGSVKAPAQAQEWKEHLQHLLGACENHQDDFEFFRKRWTTGTCDWILSHTIFKQWATDQEESPVMLWLHALPGSGKSILSSFVINHLLEESFCVYYFFRFGDQSKRSLSNCLKSTVCQIAEKVPNFRYALTDMSSSSKTLEKADPKIIWDKIFVGILFKLMLPITMYWIIDAVDESDHPQLLVEMMQGVAKSTASIKILLVSRQNDDLISTFDRLSILVPSVFLPVEDTKRDIRTCVEKEVQYMRASKKFKSMVIERMVAAAHGNFLWASLTLVEVMRCNTQEDLDETLEAMPSGMDQLYRRMESNIISKTTDRPQDQRLGHTILTWATCSRRPLALNELTQALQPEFSIVLDPQFTIGRVCGQFVTVDASNRLVMVHQTARDHIMTTDSVLAVDATEGHKKLFTKCLSVIEGQVHRRGTNLQSDDQGFVRYAVTSWAYHFNLTSVDTDEPLLRLGSFLDGNTVLAWIVSLAQLNQLKVLLVIGSNDRLIRVANLANANPTWSTLHEGLLKEDTTIDRPVHNMPWRMAFNSDASCVAVAYRGSPLCLWSLAPPKLIRRCKRSQDYAGNAWTVVDQVIWHPQSEELIGLYMGGHVFRWNPWEDTQQELQAYGSILALSSNGKFFAIGDSNGTIKLYNFHHFVLIYQLSCENLINDICFSPDSRRLYDLRGQFCNIWEPNALVRADESVEHESDVVSEAASNRTAAVSEAVAQVRDQITAIGVQFSGKHQALGNESGTVSLIDATEGSQSPFQLCRSDVCLSITHLDWSSDGNYLASAELTGKVAVRRVQLETDRRDSTATPIFEVKIPVSPEGIEQILLDKEADRLLVKNGPTVTVWSSIQEPDVDDNAGTTILLPDTKWIQHPKDSKLLLAFRPGHVQTYRWDDLAEVSTLDIQKPLFRAVTHDSPKIDQLSLIDHVVRIGSISANASGSHLLIDTVKATTTGQEHSTSILPTSALNSPARGCSVTPTLLPAAIQRLIEIPLGLLPKQRIIFLDKDHWMCSWRVGANPATEKVQKYYFLPKDWLNVEYLKLCALLADGRFLIPNNGELAVIRSATMSHW